MKIKKLAIIAPIVIVSVALAGCASESAKRVNLNVKYITSDSAPVKTSDTNSQAQIAEAATSVGHSLQRLSAIQMATHPHAKLGKPANAKAIGMAQQASLNWNGPAKPVVQKIANASGYKLRVLGNKPAIPVIVTVNASNKTLAQILRNVTFQAEPAATIKVYPKTKIIELRYNKS